jgi:hypothetical protein
VSLLSEHTSELRFLLGIKLLAEEPAPEGTRSVRKDGEWIKHGGKWQRVPKAKGASATQYAGSARAWSTAFDDREHMKVVDAHGKAEKLYRAAARAADTRIEALKQEPKQDVRTKRQLAKLTAQRDSHVTAAKASQVAKRAATKAMEAARSAHVWDRKIGHANQRDAEDNSIAFIGKSPIRGADDSEVAGSTEVPTYANQPETPIFRIGVDKIDGPEPAPKVGNLTSPGSMHVVQPRQTFARPQDLSWGKTLSKPEPDPDSAWMRALRTIEIGRQHYGRQAVFPQAAKTIGLPARFQPKSSSNAYQ